MYMYTCVHLLYTQVYSCGYEVKNKILGIDIYIYIYTYVYIKMYLYIYMYVYIYNYARN